MVTSKIKTLSCFTRTDEKLYNNYFLYILFPTYQYERRHWWRNENNFFLHQLSSIYSTFVSTKCVHIAFPYIDVHACGIYLEKVYESKERKSNLVAYTINLTKIHTRTCVPCPWLISFSSCSPSSCYTKLIQYHLVNLTAHGSIGADPHQPWTYYLRRSSEKKNLVSFPLLFLYCSRRTKVKRVFSLFFMKKQGWKKEKVFLQQCFSHKKKKYIRATSSSSSF